jgi:hypothetical protein
VRLLVVGHPAKPTDPLVVAAREADAAIEAGDGAAALDAVARILERRPTDVQALERKRRALEIIGDLRAMLVVTARLRQIHDTPALAMVARRTAGLISVTDERWAPRLPAPAELAPTVQGRTLHLVLPDGATPAPTVVARAQVAAAVERAEGKEAVVAVVSLGPDPTAAAAELDPGVEEVGLPGYPLDAPRDIAVRDRTWLAVRHAASSGAERVVLHGDPGPGAIEEMTRLLARPVSVAPEPQP